MCVDTSQKKNIKAWCVFKPSILHTSKMPYKPHTSATSPRRWLNDGNGFFLHQRAAMSHQSKYRFSAAHFIGNAVIFNQTSARKRSICKWNRLENLCFKVDGRDPRCQHIDASKKTSKMETRPATRTTAYIEAASNKACHHATAMKTQNAQSGNSYKK